MQASLESPIKIISLKAPKNPELEQIRESVLSQKVNHNEKASQLKEQIKYVHAAYLFTGSGKQVLSSLCKVISSIPSSPYYSSWKDLGSILRLSNHQIGCIEQYKFADPTELVLKAYSQSWEATLEEVVSALVAINRFDAIVEAEDGLLDLAKVARQEQIRRTEDINGGYTLHGKGTSDGILRPDHVSTLSYQLPITLKAFPSVGKPLEIKEVQKCEEKLQTSCVITKKKEKKFSKAVMLTFAADGEEIAKRLAKELRKSRAGHLPIGVLLLDEHIEKVQENPEQFIAHCFPQMHYIIPVLTKGYFQALSEGSKYQGCTFSSMDANFVTFIHDLMMKEYVKNGCRNKRFRCIIPNEELHTVLSHKHMEIDPVLKVWERESDLEKLACRILKIRRKNSFVAI